MIRCFQAALGFGAQPVHAVLFLVGLVQHPLEDLGKRAGIFQFTNDRIEGVDLGLEIGGLFTCRAAYPLLQARQQLLGLRFGH